jgi:hypothetical protein
LYFIFGIGLSIQTLATPLEWMSEHVGIKEVPEQSNRGVLIDEANLYVGSPLGSPWCAAVISLAYKKNKITSPRDARAAALFPRNRLINLRFVKAGDLGGVYFPEIGRIGHVFMVRKIFGQFVLTVEGNTNMNGSRNGDGIYYYIRPLSQVRYFSRWPYRTSALLIDDNDQPSYICPTPLFRK